MSKIWLVTGSARGLGRSIVKSALAAGDRVVATARNPGGLDDLQKQYGEQLRTFTLDVTDASAAQAAVDFAVGAFGRIDVLVNNAGYGNIAPFEQTTDADFRAQIDANFYGVVNLTRAALPVMRGQRSGHVINISSAAGRTAIPGFSAYVAAKWAVGGLTEALAMEVASLGIKVTAVEPGGMRTDWSSLATSQAPALLPDYQQNIGGMLGMLKGMAGGEIGDPEKVAGVIVDLTRRDTVPAHLLLGSDALHWAGLAEGTRQEAATEWKTISVSTNFEGVDLSNFGGAKHH